MEIKLVDLTLKQELFGFAFDVELARNIRLSPKDARYCSRKLTLCTYNKGYIKVHPAFIYY